MEARFILVTSLLIVLLMGTISAEDDCRYYDYKEGIMVDLNPLRR
jgi:hypothetical protein